MGFRASPLGKAFLVLAAFQVLATSTIIVVRVISELPATEENYEDIAFCSVLLLNAAFLLYHAFAGVLREITQDLTAFMLVATLRCIVEIYDFVTIVADQGFTGLDPLVYARFFTVVPLAVTSLIMAANIRQQFGWHAFRVVGSDTRLLDLFASYNRVVATLGIDLQLNLSLVVFAGAVFLVAPDEGDSIFSQTEVILFCIYGGLTLCWTLSGVMAMRKESVTLTNAFLALAPIAPAYIIYDVFVFLSDSAYDAYSSIVYPLIFLGLLALIARTALIVFVWKHKQHFGEGLRERVFDHKTNEDERTPLVVNI